MTDADAIGGNEHDRARRIFDRAERRIEYGYFHAYGSAEVEVPAGPVTIEVTRGLEYRPVRRTVEVKAGATHGEAVALERIAEAAGRRLANYLKVMTLEAQTIARACGKNHVHNLEPEDLCAVTIEAAAMAGVPLAGTDWIPGRNGRF